MSFENFVFIFTKVRPFIHCFVVEDGVMREVSFDLSSFLYSNQLEKVLQIDVTVSRNGTFLMSCILEDGKGLTVYFSYDIESNKFVYDDFKLSDYEFSYLISLYKNNFCDGLAVFVKGGEYSYDCRMVTHYADKSIRDVATVLAYDLTKDTKKIYSKDRAVIVEKTTNPKLSIYLYPEVIKYDLPLNNIESNYYFSNDLCYLIQKNADESIKTYYLCDGELKEFDGLISGLFDQSKVVDFEFMNDLVLIFSADEQIGIEGICLKKDCGLIENIKTANDQYRVSFKKYNKIGSNNEGVKACLRLTIEI